MKNIHLQKKDKPSRLTLLNNERLLFSKEDCELSKTKRCVNQNIYITNSEEIKEGDWFIRKNKIHQLRWDDGNSNLYTKNGLKIYKSSSKKIILTTDQTLIADGVQAIDDEFLHWFVNNPSCEEVEVSDDYFKPSNMVYGIDMEPYKIIIPKEEPKQTLEEAAEEYNSIKIAREAFIKGGLWQQEQDKKLYSEDDMKQAFENGSWVTSWSDMGIEMKYDDFETWFKTYKKK